MIKHAMYKGVCAKYGTDRKKKCEEWWREISMNSLFCIKGVCFKYNGRFFVYWINRKKLEPISTQFASGKNTWIFLKKIIFLVLSFLKCCIPNISILLSGKEGHMPSYILQICLVWKICVLSLVFWKLKSAIYSFGMITMHNIQSTTTEISAINTGNYWNNIPLSICQITCPFT